MAPSPEPANLSRRLLLTGAAAVTAALLVPARARTAPAPLGFAELYKSFGVRGLEFSDKVLALAGESVEMRGYMAPPLRAESRFFVLTREPLALCPFCQSDADWPLDIVVVYLKGESAMHDGGTALSVEGRLEAGSWTDPDTGFVSQIRIVDARFSTR